MRELPILFLFSDFSATTNSFEGLQECPKGSDTVLSQCFTKVFRELQPLMANGIPEIGIVALEPFLIFRPEKKLTLFDHPFIKIALIQNSVRVNGLTNTSRSEFSIRTHSHEVDFDFVFNQLIINTQASLEGHVFGVPLSWLARVGNLHLEFDAWAVHGKFILNETKEDNGNAFNIKEIIIGQQTVNAMRTTLNGMISPKLLGNRIINLIDSLLPFYVI